VELLVKFLIKFLNWVSMMSDLDPWASFHDKFSRNISLKLSYVRLPEEELTIQISDIDLVQINNVNISEST